ncbi:hypothetical protein J6590_098244 [Homalodisca vitripennis]|nr:hypothetical protein J6590_098244 [Homalodisca vitripennis]
MRIGYRFLPPKRKRCRRETCHSVPMVDSTPEAHPDSWGTFIVIFVTADHASDRTNFRTSDIAYLREAYNKN